MKKSTLLSILLLAAFCLLQTRQAWAQADTLYNQKFLNAADADGWTLNNVTLGYSNYYGRFTRALAKEGASAMMPP